MESASHVHATPDSVYLIARTAQRRHTYGPMDGADDLWLAIRAALPDAEELAADVAADLGEPADDVRLSVLIGTIAFDGQLGPEAAAAAAIRAELVRLQSVHGTGPKSRLLAVGSLEDLLVEARALQATGSLDLETIVAIQRASGAIAARTDRPMVALLHRYAVTRRQIWEHCVAAMQAGRLDPDAWRASVASYSSGTNSLHSPSPTATDSPNATSSPAMSRPAEVRSRNYSALLPTTRRVKPDFAALRCDTD